MKLKVLSITGILPKDNPEMLFKRLRDYSGEEKEITEERTIEEIQESLARLMKTGRFMKGRTQ